MSKWENGDADPEIGKLKLLAQLFQVSTDWLLSEEDPVEYEEKQNQSVSPLPPYPHWTENLPGIIGKLIRKYGWLLGVYIAIMGTLSAGLGMFAKFMTRRMFGSFFVDIDGSENPFGDMVINNPVTLMANFIMYAGITMIIAGIVLAVILKNKSRTVKD